MPSHDHELPPERFVRKIIEDVLTDPKTGDWRDGIGLEDTSLMSITLNIEDITHKIGQNRAFLNLMREIEESGEIPAGRTEEARPDYEAAQVRLERKRQQLRDLIKVHLDL